MVSNLDLLQIIFD